MNAYLKSLCDTWEDQLQVARDRKEEDFGRTARTLWGFMNKSYQQLYVQRSARWDEAILPMPGVDQQTPYYKPRIMKCREFVNVVLPWVFAQVPNRLVQPRRPPLPGALLDLAAVADQEDVDPSTIPVEIQLLQAAAHGQTAWTANEQIVSYLLGWYLNYIVQEYGARKEQRTAIQEALVKGRGVVWHSLSEAPTGLMPSSYFDSVDGLFVDPDAKQWRDCGYIFRERTWPAWRLADTFGVDEDKIRGACRGHVDAKAHRVTGVPETVREESDACTWFEVWSRIGPGQRLYKASESLKEGRDARQDALDEVGNNVYFAFLPGLGYPLNIHEELWENGTTADIVRKIRWPLALHEDTANPFPCTPLDIYPNPDNPWATSPLYAGISLQIFLDHIYSFIMGRLRVTSRSIIVTAKQLDPALKEAINSGLDQITVPTDTEQVERIERLLHVVQFPDMKEDLWRVMAHLERAFEMATGMDPLLYGGEPSRAMRSAKEAGVREAAVTNRPRDYADAVQEWSSKVARAEGQLTRMYVEPPFVAPLFREPVTEDPAQYGPLTTLWASLVNTDDPAAAVADLHYTVEAGSGRRKNKQTQIENFQLLVQTIQPILQAFATAGQTGPWNSLMDMLGETYDQPMNRLKLPVFQPPAKGGQSQ